jgi:predicted dehydrogenase
MKKVLVVGYGSIGKRHVKNLLTFSDIEIILYTKRKDLKLNEKRIRIHDSLELCINENPDVAFITNETRYHIPVAIELARYGADLFLEKPLSDTMSGVNTLRKIMHDKKLITQMGCNFRFYPPIKKIKQLLVKKTIGKVISIQVENGSYLPDWHPYEDYRFGYAARSNLGGGVLLTQIHEIDYLYWFLGKVTEVTSITGKYSDLEIGVDDLSTSLLRFENNVIGELHLDYFQRPFFKRCKIRGTNGIIEWDSESNKVRLYRTRKRSWEIVNIQGNYRLSSKEKVNLMYLDELRHFLSCVKKRKPTINTIDDGAKTLQIALCIKKASKLKKSVKIQ